MKHMVDLLQVGSREEEEVQVKAETHAGQIEREASAREGRGIRTYSE